MTLTNQVSDRPAKRGPGRPQALAGDAIAEAVLATGFTGLTFAAVAGRLGVGQATLYRHAANRDELVRLGLDLALRRTKWPDLDGSWRPLLERWALVSWHAWEAHPGAVLEATRGVIPASMIQLSDRVGVALVNRGFTPRNAVLAVDLVFDLVADSRRGVETLAGALEAEFLPVRQTMERHWSAHRDSTHGDSDHLGVDEVTAQLRDEMVRAIREEPVVWFRGKLRIVLTGIEQELAPGARP
ncbi:MAG: TetR/AcrR family transcriptional regulator [Brevibacterium aurantiacum]